MTIRTDFLLTSGLSYATYLPLGTSSNQGTDPLATRSWNVANKSTYEQMQRMDSKGTPNCRKHRLQVGKVEEKC